jgi:hypothetical protein
VCSSQNAATAQHSDAPRACTLAAYAEAKRLPVEFLSGLGLTDVHLQGSPAIRIPYRCEDGADGPVRFRVRLHRLEDGDGRFSWRKGSKPTLYGLDRLSSARAAGHVVLVEGESDCHTLWHHGVPALGIPGAGTWRDEWAKHLTGIETVYFVVEPDHGGDALQAVLGRSPLRDRLRLVSLEPHKDASELHIADPDGFKSAFDAALGRAEPWRDVERARSQRAASEAWAECQEIAHADDVLDLVARFAADGGVAGEGRLVRLLYLAVTSRFLDRPVSVAVKGPSSGGKSFVVERVLAMFPPGACYALTAMSERALAYSTEPLAHRILVVYEASGMSGDMQSYLLRSLLSEGRIKYEFVEKTASGLKPRLIEREGPTGLIVTTTAIGLHPENETRMLSVTVTDTPDQTRRILLAATDRVHSPPNASRLIAFQVWLEHTDHDVVIPYARLLAELVPPVAVRLRRDFAAVLSLIRAHALLHQANRAKDRDGAIVATTEDYAAVRALVADLVAEGVQRTVKPETREAVQAVSALAAQPDRPVTNASVAKKLQLDPSATSRRLRAAADAGYLINEETRRGKPARYVLGEPMPEEQELLPSPEVLRRCTMNEGAARPLSPVDNDAFEEV